MWKGDIPLTATGRWSLKLEIFFSSIHWEARSKIFLLDSSFKDEVQVSSTGFVIVQLAKFGTLRKKSSLPCEPMVRVLSCQACRDATV